MRAARCFTFSALVSACALGHPKVAQAQQSLFNVPSGTSTVAGGTFFQEQFNCGTLGESNTTVEVGILKDLELGLNLLHVDVYGHATSLSARSVLAGNLIWTPRLNDWLTFQVGTSLGAGHDEVNLAQEFVGYSWSVLRARLGKSRITAIAGAYAGTAHWLGPGWPAGPLVGLEVELIPDHLVVMGDFVIGDHEQAVGVFGPVVYLPFGWQLSLGFQVPSPSSLNEYEGVVELTHLPSAAPADAPHERRATSPAAPAAPHKPDAPHQVGPTALPQHAHKRA